MRIGINALYLLPGKVGGTEIYLRSLLCALATLPDQHEYVVFLNEESEEAGIVPSDARFHSRATGVHAANRPARLVFEQTGLARHCREERLDVLLNAGFTAPWNAPCPSVTVIHDLQFREHHEFFSLADVLGWRVFVGAAIRRSARLISISHSTKEQLLRYYTVQPESIDVVWQGIDEQFFGLDWQPDEVSPYLLTVSTLHPHKNLDRLLRAFARFHERHPGVRLVIAGMAGNAAGELEALRSSLRLGESVEFTYWIPRKRLYELFQHATAFVFPSRYEGFGIPVVEALAAGIPTVCSDIPVLREIGGDAVLRFEVNSDESLESAITRIWTDSALRGTLTAQGRKHADQFRWRHTAVGTLESLTKAVQQRTERISGRFRSR